MKRCPYCGKEYPDEVKVCAIDGESLSAPVVKRRKVTGTWRGVYAYGERNQGPGMAKVAFTLQLKQGWMEHFTGSVTEDAPHGFPGRGVVDGYFKAPTIEFTKQMPVGYTIGSSGVRMTLRESVMAQGYECKEELPSSPIHYEGTFLDTNRVQGTWVINPSRIVLADGESLLTKRSAGFWCAEFVSVETNVHPTTGPAEPLFDKSLLSPEEVEAVEGDPLCSLGKFSATDAKRISLRFEEENIRFRMDEFHTTDNRMSPTIASVRRNNYGTYTMLEIVVHPEDEAQARAILAEDVRV